ncbi:MAG: hypothetical protein QOE70_6131 [Chthoniobacter sp.]|jgi:hypothetical protein|nr:hypothetical protein [Chthoniobacter sp.]
MKQSRFLRSAAAALALATLFYGSRASATSIVFENTNNAGSQGNYVLGMDFMVNRTITVNLLGAFDANQDGFSSTVSVGIFQIDPSNFSLGSLVSPQVNLLGSSATLIGNSRFVSVTPFTLAPGRYSIVASGFDLDATNQNGNTGIGGTTSFNSLGGALSLVSQGGRWNDSSQAFVLPTQHLGGYGQPDPVFLAGTFGVPDGGSTVLLLGLAVTGLALVRRSSATLKSWSKLKI